jgi:formylglycine-generating enzyme required for sulfatase activity
MSNLTIIQTPGTARYYREQLGNSIELEMVLIKRGTFMMGSPDTEEGHHNSEGPQHEVTVPTFFMGRYPVTQEQWQIVAETYPKVSIELRPKPSRFEGDRRPVEFLDYSEAEEFCARLANRFNRPYRLPSEAEWEYACRAGTTTPFYFGNTISTNLAKYVGSYTYGNGEQGYRLWGKETTPVDQFEVANLWGLCDMHGNVNEWCQDFLHHNYEGAPIDGSAWLLETNSYPRVLRGGSSEFPPWECRSAYRYPGYSDGLDSHPGCRVACSGG